MRYVLHPGWIVSPVDEQRHFISGQALARLYNVPFHECVFGDKDYFEQAGDVHLYPRKNGDYSISKLRHRPTPKFIVVKPGLTTEYVLEIHYSRDKDRPTMLPSSTTDKTKAGVFMASVLAETVAAAIDGTVEEIDNENRAERT